MQEFAAFGDTVAKLTDAKVLLEYSRECREFYLVIGPSEDEEQGAVCAPPLDTSEAPANITPDPAPSPAPTHTPYAPTFPATHTAFLHLPGVRNDN